MAAGGPRADAATRNVERRALRHRPAGPVVAVRRGDRRARGRVGMAAPRGPAVTSAGSGRRETGGVSLWRRLVQAVRGPSGAHSAEAERILLEADFGVEATERILQALPRTGDDEFRLALERALVAELTDAVRVDGGALARASAPPTVMLVFGVNGVGKTTAVAKLGARLARGGRSVLLAAADTFRAGAPEQLQIWADRLGVPCVTGGGTKDPAAVAFDDQ